MWRYGRFLPWRLLIKRAIAGGHLKRFRDLGWRFIPTDHPMSVAPTVSCPKFSNSRLVSAALVFLIRPAQ
jgi:hypothetical protein